MRLSARIWILLVAAVVAGLPQSASADDDMWDKGGRGIADILSSPYEVIRQGQIDHAEKGGLGVFTGGFRGIGTMAQRLGVGAYELVTFPFPSYEPILDPEYGFPEKKRARANWGEDEITHVY